MTIIRNDFPIHTHVEKPNPKDSQTTPQLQEYAVSI